MTEAPPAAPPRKWTRSCANVAAVVILVALAAAGGAWWWARHAEQQALARQEERAKEVFAPAMDRMKEATASPAAPARPAYDIDDTIRVVYEIDLAVQNADSLQDWLQQLAHQDYRDVAPEVLEARMRTLDVLLRLYARQVELEDQQALWDFSSGYLLLGALSVVGVEGHASALGASGALDVDREQARRLLDELVDAQDEHARLLRELRQAENELFTSMVDSSQIYYRYLDEWDRLGNLRDRAYLAAWNGDWDTAVAAADQAIAAAPLEREAHLVKALALIESGRALTPEGGAEVEELLARTMDEHPDQTAPAWLLLGVLKARRGDAAGARLDLQQAAAYYPKQADRLTDMLDPYKMRSFLRKSREGTYIVELYKSTMLGSGYFSPDLQLARLAFESGDREGGRRKVMDHFARRRAQQQWDYLLSDLAFCQDLLGDDYRAIFPEDFYLDLVVKPTVFGSKLDLAVRNRSDTTLHNATLVLAVQFTDMHPADYETFLAGETRPAVLAHDTTDFGTTEIKLDLHGMEKSVDDVVTHRAILVANEAVVWVDTDAYKLAEAGEFHSAASEAPAASRPPTARSGARETVVQRATRQVLAEAERESTLSVDVKKLVKDDVVIRLPKELVMLRPLFRLQNAATGTWLEADENLIVGDHIELRFSGVDDFADRQASRLDLVATTPVGDVVLTWNQDVDGSFRLDRVDLAGR